MQAVDGVFMGEGREAAEGREHRAWNTGVIVWSMGYGVWSMVAGSECAGKLASYLTGKLQSHREDGKDAKRAELLGSGLLFWHILTGSKGQVYFHAPQMAQTAPGKANPGFTCRSPSAPSSVICSPVETPPAGAGGSL